MTDYEELVEALRCCSKDKCGQCEYEWNLNREFCMNSMCADAAAAIEALEARLGEAENSVERWKDMYLTKHEPKRGQYVHGRELSREYIGDCLVSIDYEDWRCSVCGIVFEQWSIPKYNYCPNCGAKMGGME